MSMAELTDMENIGKELKRKLVSIGVEKPEQLAALGAKKVFARLKAVYPQVCLVHLYALQGALMGCEWNRLPEKTKKDLKGYSDLLKQNG